MIQVGDVIFDQHYIYNDGTEGKKLLVVMAITPNYIVTCKVTSKAKRYQTCASNLNANTKCLDTSPSHIEDVFFIKANHDGFNKDTFVQFSAGSFRKTSYADISAIKRIFQLTSPTMQNLIKCAKNSQDIPQDINMLLR